MSGAKHGGTKQAFLLNTRRRATALVADLTEQHTPVEDSRCRECPWEGQRGEHRLYLRMFRLLTGQGKSLVPRTLSINTKIRTKASWDTRVARSVKRPRLLVSAQVMTSWFVGSSPALGSMLTAQSLLGIVSLPLSLPVPCSLSLSFSINK